MKQHWVPRSYLSPWADPETAGRENPLVWALDIKEHRLFHPSVKNIFAETHMYSIIKKDGTRDISQEQRLARIEGEFTEARDRLERGAEPTPDDEGLFATYAAVMHARSKSMRDHHRGQWQNVLDRTDEMDNRIQEMGEDVFSRVAETSDPRNVITREGIEHAIKNMGAVILPVIAEVEAGIYASMNWAVIVATGSETFITSDRPCAWLDNEPPERGYYQRSPLMSKGLEVYLPISPRRCFIWSHASGLAGERPIGDRHVRMMNLWLAAQATDFLIRERPLFEKAYCDNPRLARAVAGIFLSTP